MPNPPRPNRPLSVWLTQAILLLGGLQMLVALLGAISFCVAAGELRDCFSPPRLTVFVAGLIVLGIAWVTFRGLQRRKHYGRWLAIGFLIVGMVSLIADSPYFQLIYQFVIQGIPLPAPPYECWHDTDGLTQRSCGYSSYPDLLLRGSLDILLPNSVAMILVLRLLRGRAVRRFFADRTGADPLP
jgi:hypothetical protein